jgi:type I restriction enzyme S subunit
MELKPGYKQTEVGVIPEDWRVKTLGSITTLLTNGFVGKATDFYVESDDGVLYIQGYNVEENGFNFHNIRRVSKGFHARHQKSCLQAGDLLTIQTGDIGVTTVVPHTLAGANCHALVISRLDKRISEPSYYCQYFNSEHGRVAFKEIETGSTMKHLNVGDMTRLYLPSPPLIEQRSIAGALSDVDALISGLDQLIVKKRDIKQAAMQRLLTGKQRLPGFGGARVGYKQTEAGVIPEDWEVKTLGELGKFKNGINKGKEEFGHGFPFVNLMDVFGIATVSNNSDFGLVNSSADERKLYELNKGDVLFVRSSVKPEGVGLTTLVCEVLPDTVFSGFLIRFRDSGLLNLEYKKYCFGLNGFRTRLIANSTVSANTNVNQDALKALRLAFPPEKKEQTAIATVLTDMDAEIAALEQRRDKTRDLKQGMMQELLTGRIRLV